MFLSEQEVIGKRVYGATAYYNPTETVHAELHPSVEKKSGYTRLPGEGFKSTVASVGAPAVIQEARLRNMRLMPDFGYFGMIASIPASELVFLQDKASFSKSRPGGIKLWSGKHRTRKDYAKNSPAFASLG